MMTAFGHGAHGHAAILTKMLVPSSYYFSSCLELTEYSFIVDIRHVKR